METTGKRINIHDATIKTATVEVKTLTISGKQVTLAVFRQLQDEEIFHVTFALRGVPWGKVNYCPDECRKAQYGHVHVVWQKGNELRRSTVYWDPNQHGITNLCVEERHKWSKMYGSLVALDQLFIAV